MQLTLKVGESEIRMTREEARDLLRQLKEVFPDEVIRPLDPTYFPTLPNWYERGPQCIPSTFTTTGLPVTTCTSPQPSPVLDHPLSDTQSTIIKYCSTISVKHE